MKNSRLVSILESRFGQVKVNAIDIGHPFPSIYIILFAYASNTDMATELDARTLVNSELPLVALLTDCKKLACCWQISHHIDKVVHVIVSVMRPMKHIVIALLQCDNETSALCSV